MMLSTSASSGSSNSGQKVSMFVKKPGFVIPKNKPAGSLVPVFKGGKSTGGNAAANEGSTEQLQRKTKWGPDLTQDAAVKKGRALAYQTRVDQITQQLKSGASQTGGVQELKAADQHVHPESSSLQIGTKNTELLEFEKLQAIGEILKLNPSYKVPPDYKPLLKEAEVSIPVKDYPGFNFVSLIIGPKSETLKRLEKETGAKIFVVGTKAMGEKVELSSDDIENHNVYRTLSVHLSAETYEKVDAAAAVIELLLTSVIGNSATGTLSSNFSQSHDVFTPSMAGAAQTPQQGHFMYQGLQFSEVTSQAPWSLPSGFMASQNIPSERLDDPGQLQSSCVSHPTMPPPFQLQPVSALGASVPKQHPPAQASPPGNFFIPLSQNLLPFNTSQSQPMDSSMVERTLTSTLPPVPQSNLPVVPAGSSSVWPGARASGPTNLGLGNMGQIRPTDLPGPPWPVVTEAGSTPSAPPSNVEAAANIVSAINLLLRQSSSQFSIFPVNHPAANENFTLRQPMLPASSPRGSGDFTFLPHHHRNTVPQPVPRMSNMLSTHTLPRPMIPSAQARMPPFPFPGSTGSSFSHTLPAFQDTSPMALGNPALKRHNVPGTFPPRPGNVLPLKQNYPPSMTQGNFIPPDHQFNGGPTIQSGRPASSPGGPQIYDPFSPTSV